MSIYAGAVINAIPRIETKTYAELGLGIPGPMPVRAQLPTGQPVHLLDAAHGSTWIQVRARQKYGVDVQWGPFVTHCMTTREFFALDWLPAFDVIFVDANHMADAVLEDFNNACDYLSANGGVIVAHDLVPPDKEHADNPGKCGDGYKVLQAAMNMGMEHWTLDEDMGLTVFPKPQRIAAPADVDWPTFMENIRPHRMSLTELVRRVSELP